MNAKDFEYITRNVESYTLVLLHIIVIMVIRIITSVNVVIIFILKPKKKISS